MSSKSAELDDGKLMLVFMEKLRSMWPHPDSEIHTRWGNYLETLKEIGVEKRPWGANLSEDETQTLDPLGMAKDDFKSIIVMRKETAIKILTLGLP